MLTNQLSEHALLFFDLALGVDKEKVEFSTHGKVLLQLHSLERRKDSTMSLERFRSIPASKYFSAGRPLKMRPRVVSRGARKKKTKSG